MISELIYLSKSNWLIIKDKQSLIESVAFFDISHIYIYTSYHMLYI